jgi:hypothetical protein
MKEEFDTIFSDEFTKDVTPASSVERKINKVIQKMDRGLTYIFDNWATANIRIDKLPLPAVINVLPVSGSFNVTARKMKDYPNCMLAFIDKTDLDFDGEENDVVLERCKNLAMEFILTANESELFDPIEGDVPYSVIYDKMDVNVTGIVIEIQLKEKQGINLCYGKPIKDYFK